MLCEQIGVRESYCLHRTRYTCDPSLPAPAGIVIACTNGRRAADVRDAYGFPLDPNEYALSVPPAADYLINSEGDIDLLVQENCAPRWTNQQLSNRYIVILVEGREDSIDVRAIRSAARLACCLVRAYRLQTDPTAPVYPAGAIAQNLCLQQLPSAFWRTFSACLLGELIEPDGAAQPQCCDVLRDSIRSLERIIDDLIQRVRALEQRPNLEPRVQALEQAVSGLTTRVGTVESLIASLQSQIFNLSNRLVRMERCYDRLPQCREQAPPCEVVYRVSTPQNFVPLAPHRIDFDQRVSDDSPPIVSTGLWQAMIGDGGAAKIWRVIGEIVIAPRKWCVNKGVRVFLRNCDGTRALVAQWVAPSDGQMPPVTLSWDLSIAVNGGQYCFIWFEVESEDTTEPFLTIDSGIIRLTR